MRKKITHIPDVLSERLEMLRELETDKQIAKSFAKGAQQAEIDFVNARIQELERELSENEAKATELINKIREIDFIAYTATYQRFIRGLQWKEVAFDHGLTEDSIKKHYYKAMQALHQSKEV